MIKNFLPAMAILLSLSAALPAQDKTGGQTRQTPVQPAAEARTTDGSKSVDECVAHCLALCNGSEVALAEFVSKRVQHQSVKDFVAMVNTEHAQCQDKLVKLNPQYAEISTQLRTAAKTTPENNRNDDTRTNDRLTGEKAQTLARDSSPETDRTISRAQSDLANQMFLIEQATAANCLRMTMAELESVPADKFDMAFVGTQLGNHIHMIAKLEAVQPYVSSEMRPMVDQCLKSARNHMDVARKLCKTLEQDKTAGQKTDR